MSGPKKHNAVLDTCALLWLAEGGGNLSQAALDDIEGASTVALETFPAT